MLTRTEDDEEMAWELLSCVLGVLLVLVGSGSLQCGLLTAVRRRLSPTHRRIVDLQAEIREHQAELNKIPIMDEFAAHCRKKRIVEKLTADLQTLVHKRDKQELQTSLAWSLVGKAACTSAGFFLAAKSADLSILCVNSSHFFPFNFLLAYPCASEDPAKSPVSLFSFLLLSFFVARTFHRRVIVGPVRSVPFKLQ
ncbi:hypothetical protein M3Y99_01751700 [Aphelenchoides fujianensis]|nr:hypothetical protein M3Y99_01751700 [Aphelenchoides fujianensis]